MMKACMPREPTSAACAETLNRPPPVAADDQALRLPDSKPSAKMASFVGVAVRVGVGLGGTGVGVRVGVGLGGTGVGVGVGEAGTLVGVGVEVDVPPPVWSD